MAVVGSRGVPAEVATEVTSHPRVVRLQVATSFPLALVVLAVVGVSWVLAWHTGSLVIPHNDAWSHSLITQRFAGTGRLQMVGWNRTALIGQIVGLAPFGRSVAAQQTAVALMACSGVVAAFHLCAPRWGRRRALFVAATLAAVPEFGLLSTSTMSDVPALAGALVALALGDRAVRLDRPGLLTLSALVGLWAATVREQAVAAPVAVLVAACLAWRGPRRRLPLGLGAAVVVLFVAFELWRRGLPYGDPPVWRPSPEALLPSLVSGSLWLGLACLPVAFVVARPWRWRGAGWIAALAVGGLGLRHVLQRPEAALMGNYLGPGGPYGSASVRWVYPLHEPRLWTAVAAAGLVGATLAAGHLAHTRPRPGAVLGVFGALTVVGTVAQVATGQHIFGRYLLALVVVVAAALLVPGEATAGVEGAARSVITPVGCTLAVVTGAALCLLGWGMTATATAYDAARWRLADRVVAGGIAPTDIDAGLEWVGWHATAPATPDHPSPGPGSWFVHMFAGSRPCVVVTSGRWPVGHRIASLTYRPWGGVLGRQRISAYDTGWCPQG